MNQTILPLAFLIPLAIMGVNYLPHSEPLCINGHPAPRQPTTYAGLPTADIGDQAHPWCTATGCERDHIIPRCLGGPDTRDNIQYQPWPEAHQKDARERQACEAFCRGDITPDQARSQFHREWP
jgi:hypothetical protein